MYEIQKPKIGDKVLVRTRMDGYKICVIDCVVICSFERNQNNVSKNVKYRLESKEHKIYDNINRSDIILNKI